MPRSLLLSAALVAVVLAPAGPARSEDVPSTKTPSTNTPSASTLDERWIPSLTGTFLYMNYHAEAETETTLGFPAQGSPSEGIPLFQFGLEMLSPAATQVPTAPHFWGFGGIQIGPAHKTDLASAGAIEAGQPELSLLTPGKYDTAAEVPGQGSQVIGRYRSMGWYLGMGMTFDVPTHDPIFRVRPYATYVGEQARVKGQVVQVTGTKPNYAIERVAASNEDIYHYIGPGLELEILLNANESWAISFFARGDLLWNVGNDSATFSDPTGQATFHYKTDGFQPRGGFGLRLSWLSAF